MLLAPGFFYLVNVLGVMCGSYRMFSYRRTACQWREIWSIDHLFKRVHVADKILTFLKHFY